MPTRREFLAASVALAIAPPAWGRSKSGPVFVNDIHSQLNRTRVDQVLKPSSVKELQQAVRSARAEGKAISVAGGRHAMGGQQFGTDTILVDTANLNRVINFDRDRGTIEVEAGIQWPELINTYLRMQPETGQQWGIAQKQTGADRISIGGTVACNAHGRGLTRRPFISDVESLTLIDAEGNSRRCSRTENPDLFKLVVGGYGLFGLVSSVTLRLVSRRKVQRVVEIRSTDGLLSAFRDRIAAGFSYGDFQFSVDQNSEDFLRKGVFSCYREMPRDTPMPENHKELSDESWRTLLYLAHTDKGKAFDTYANYYLSTNGQLYWSDTHQLSIYPDNYHREIDKKLHSAQPATEIITEINVPREMLKGFLDEVRDDFRKNKVQLIYGTVRLIEKDDASFLPWAKQSYACTIFNLHTVHSKEGIEHSAQAFRRLIDMAIRRGGTYYLTYHKYATRNQVEACYPNFAELLQLKRKYDPKEIFQSDWYRHYRKMFA
ncbi:MAG: L-gulono,4-lactone dehydrogenase [Acidobacteriales bacterium]|nr:L-gulono,4-lactone dehydrogenase [Terriglobales bacterium]